MLLYAFQVLNEQGYKNIATEQFNNTAELMAAILAKGITVQIKRGLGKEYILRQKPYQHYGERLILQSLLKLKLC